MSKNPAKKPLFQPPVVRSGIGHSDGAEKFSRDGYLKQSKENEPHNIENESTLNKGWLVEIAEKYVNMPNSTSTETCATSSQNLTGNIARNPKCYFLRHKYSMYN